MNQRCLLIPLFLALAFGVYRYPSRFDMTHTQINTLPKAYEPLLSKIEAPLQVEIFTPEAEIKRHIQAIIALFQKENALIRLSEPAQTLTAEEKKRLKIQSPHFLLLKYKDRLQAVDIDTQHWKMQSFGTLLYQLIRQETQWVVFLTNHGEQTLEGKESRNLHLLNQALQNHGFKVAYLNLAQNPSIPSNTQLLVLADAEIPLWPSELSGIEAYLQKGGNFLWLASPLSSFSAPSLESTLGISWKKGLIQDPEALTKGAPGSAIQLITHYPAHPITETLKLLTVFPESQSLESSKAESLGWHAQTLLTTSAQSTRSTEKTKGPFTLGLTLEKEAQRVALIGNSHFISNAGLPNYGNLTFTLNLFNWLTHTDVPFVPPLKDVGLAALTYPPFMQKTVQWVFPYGLPFLYLCIGWGLSFTRQRRSKLRSTSV